MLNKRPKTTNSAFSLDKVFRKSSLHNVQPQNLPTITMISDKIKKWQEISKQVHRELQLSACIARSSNSHKSLHKMGGRSFLLHKSVQQQQQSTKNVVQMRPMSCNKKQNGNNYNCKALENYRTVQKQKTTIKRFSRQYIDNKANAQYDKMVLKIGSNMQYEQKFTTYYIQNIKKVQIIDPTPMPIVYGIKSQTQSYNPCMTSFKNEQMPICISLFTESFHAKLEQSIIKKRQYLQRMKDQMNGTYDPQIMSRMQIVGKKPAICQNDYYQQLPKFYTDLSNQQQKCQLQIIEKVARQSLKQFCGHPKIKQLEYEVLSNYKRANSIVSLDYFLKQPANLSRMGMLRQFLTSEIQNVTSFRILYHGGYSKSLYREWNKLYQLGQAQLPKKIVKLCSKVQLVNEWIQQFNNLNMVESNLFQVLLSPISPTQMKALHLMKIENSFLVFKNICIKGIMTILVFNRRLWKKPGQHQLLTSPISKYFYLNKFENGIKSALDLNLSNQNEITSWFSQILQNQHTQQTIQHIEDLQQISNANNEQIFYELDLKRINKSVSILVNIFYESIVSRSLSTFINIFDNPSQPLMKLNLVVDRQSLKIEESQDFIIEIFDKIINVIINKKVSCTSAGFQIKQNVPDKYKQYGNLFLPTKEEQTLRSNFDWQLNIQYRNYEIQENRINELTEKIRDWYHESQMIIQNFSCFMPFIKLTAKEKIFIQEQDLTGMSQWDQAKHVFSTNRQKVQFYRQKLAQTPVKFTVGIFEIDCSQPHKILRDRIAEIQYLFQQKYLSKIFQKIHEMQQDLARIMTMLHSVNIKINNIEDIAEMLDKSKQQLIETKKRSQQLSHHIYFYIDKAKSNTVITRFTQLLHKRVELLLKIEELKEKVKQDSCYLEIKREQQRTIFVANAEQVSRKLKQFCKQCFEINKLDRFLEVIKSMSDELEQYHNQFNEVKDPNYSYQEEQQLFEDKANQISIVHDFWSNVNKFNTVIKELALQKIRQVQISSYEKIIESCNQIIPKFQSLNFEFNQINAIHVVKQKQDIKRHKELLDYLKILADNSVSLEYFVMFDCQSLLNMPFRNLISLKNWDEYMPKLKQMQVKAKAEQQIFIKFTTIQKRFQSLRLNIIDVHGCDTLDPDLTKQMVEILHESCFECERLLLLTYAKKYSEKIERLMQRMRKCQDLVLKWLQVERKFVQLEAYYTNNDEVYFKQTFKRISESHRKIIKSFDMDNSLIILPSNIFLVTSLESSKQALEGLKKDLFSKFNQLQSSVARLQLLTHQELLEVMSFIKMVPKYLPRCFPSIQNFGLNQQSLDRVGGHLFKSNQNPLNKTEIILGNYIQLREPIHLGSRLANMETWIQKMLSDIKQSIKKSFNSHSDKKQSSLQILQLKQQIQFTEEIEQILQNEEMNKLLESYIRTIEAKINVKSKSGVQRYNTQMMILLLIMERDYLASLCEAVHDMGGINRQCFQWLKYARFYNMTQQEPKKQPKVEIKMEILTDSYKYNFMFIEKCDMVIQDVLFIGNCIIGKKGSGKKSIIKHYAYMTGNQLFIFEKGHISQNVTENIVNFYKLAITTGGWLLIPDVNLMNPEQMRTIAQCLSYLNNAITAKLPKMEIFVYKQFNLNENCRVFFTLENLNNIQTRLAHNFRPIWICAPSPDFISEVCNQVASISDNKLLKQQAQASHSESINGFVFKIIDFIHMNRYHENVPLYLARSMLERGEKPSNQLQKYIPNSNFLNLLLTTKFILPEDLGLNPFIEQTLPAVIEANCSCVIYLPIKQCSKFVQSNFFEEDYVFLKIYDNSYQSLKRVFNYLRSRIKKSQIKYLILEQSLKFHNDIEMQSKQQNLLRPSPPKILYLQNIKNLSQQAHLRLHSNLPTIMLPSGKNEMHQDPIKRQLTRKKSTKNSTFQNYSTDLQMNYQNIIQAFVHKYLKSKLQLEEIEEIIRWFQKLYSRLVFQKYSKDVAFVFAVAWILGNYITQKDIIHLLNLPQYDFAYQKTLKYCSNLRQLYPKKNFFISISSLLQQSSNLCINDQSLPIKSIILSNIKLIREILNDEITFIKSQACPEQIMTTLFSNGIHIYPLQLPNLIACKDIIQHQLNVQILENLHFVFHGIDRVDPDICDFVIELARKKEVFYIQRGDLNVFKQRKCQITMSGCSASKIPKTNSIFTLNIFQDEMVSIEINQLQSIRALIKNCSNLSQSIYKGLLSFYRNNFSKFYWVSQPVRPAFARYCKSKRSEDFFLLVLRYLLLALPNEKTKIINQICYGSTSTSTKADEIEYQIKISTAVDTIKNLEETLLNSQIEIRSNICKDMIVMNQTFNAIPYSYDMLYKTYLAISQSHTILLGSIFTQRYYCLQTISKILNLTITPFSYDIAKQNKKQSSIKKSILLISEKDVCSKMLSFMESLICDENSVVNRNYIVVLKLSTENNSSEQFYRAYPYLKKYFVQVFFAKKCQEDITKNINLVKTLKYLENGDNRYELSVLNDWGIPPELEVQKSISQYFEVQLCKNFGFLMRLLQLRRQFQEQQFNKYKFYRALTEQLFHTISMLGQQLKQIPKRLEMISSKEQYINNCKKQIQIVFNKLEQATKESKKQIEILDNCINAKNIELQANKQKISNDEKQFQTNFKKIYTKMDNLGVQDHSKFKSNPDNQLVNMVYSLISGLIKWEPGKLKKIPTIKLDLISREKNFKWDKYRELIRKILQSHKNVSSKKGGQKLATVLSFLIQWIENIEYFKFRNAEQSQKALEAIEKIDKQIEQLKIEAEGKREKLGQKQKQLKEYQNGIQELNDQLIELEKSKSVSMVRQQRIEVVLHEMADKQQKIKISKDLAERLYFLPKIIMSKSINQMALNEYDDDRFIVKQLFLRSNREQDQHEILDHELFMYNVPIFQNIFDDFQAVLEMYRKYNIVDLDFDQAKLIQTIICSKERVQIVEDAYELISTQMFDLFGNHLNYKVLDLSNARLEVSIKQILLKCNNYNKIIIHLSRFEKENEVKKLFEVLVSAISEKESLKIVVVMKKIEDLYHTDRFRWIGNKRVCLTYRKYLRQFAKIGFDKMLTNEWEYYQIENQFNKSHKTLFQAFEKFKPENTESYDKMLEAIKVFDQIRSKRKQICEIFEQYFENLSAISPGFGSYYVLLKYLEMIDRVNPIQMFEEGGLFKNYQIALKKSVAQLYGIEMKNNEDLFKSFVVHMSYQINFVDQQQVIQYCMMVAFLFTKPSSVTSYFIIQILKNVQKCKNESEKVRYIIKAIEGKQISVNFIDKMLQNCSFDSICQPWVEYLITSTLQINSGICQNFLSKLRSPKLAQTISKIRERNSISDSHYYSSKCRLDFKNEFKLTSCRQRACKYYWIIRVKKEHIQRFMQVLQSKVHTLREEIKLVNFFFNQNKQESNLQKLLELSERKMFVCIFNLGRQKSHIIEDIISHIWQRSKNIHQMFKIFFLTQDCIFLKNRQHIDYITFTCSQEDEDESKLKGAQSLVLKATKSIKDDKKMKIKTNLQIIHSLNIIIEKCTNKMLVFKHKDKIYKFLLEVILQERIMHNQGNCMKFVLEYFKVAKVNSEKIMHCCKIKEHLLGFAQNKLDMLNIAELGPSPENVAKWNGFLAKLQQSIIQQKYKVILKQMIDELTEQFVKGRNSKILINEGQMKSIIKYGWLKISSPQTLKFLLYKGLHQALKQSNYEYNYDLISELKIVCEIENKLINFKLLDFNNIFGNNNVVDEIQMKVLAVPDGDQQPMIDTAEIQAILQQFNVRISLVGDKDMLGKLYLAFK